MLILRKGNLPPPHHSKWNPREYIWALVPIEIYKWMIAVRGLINRSIETDLMHSCGHGDLTISEADRGIKVFVEGFIRGQLRFLLFDKPQDVAPGWVHVGPYLQTNVDCRQFCAASITVLACSAEIMANRPQTPTPTTAPTTTVPPPTQHHFIACENAPTILAPTPIRVSAAATILNNVQIDGDLAVPGIVVQPTPSQSQDDATLFLLPTPSPSAGTVQLSLAVPVTRPGRGPLLQPWPTLRRTVSYESAMRNAQPLLRLQIPVVVEAVSVPQIPINTTTEISEDDFELAGRETSVSASALEPESPEGRTKWKTW
ncbi:hypothetical protein FPQ18DRAFT_393897 [Pyronema domesticum]|nr:hypothetical protein FPQ18DRAFT_393897 [Pyronema domesticum]